MLKEFQTRRSHRQFLPKNVEEEKITEILKAIMTAPTARHTRAWEIIVVKDKDLIQKLAATKAHSEFAKNAPVVFVLCSKDWDYWLEDMSIAATYIYLQAEEMGLGTCWTQIRGSKTYDGSDAESYVRKVLNIPSTIRVLCLMPLGYPALTLPAHTDEEYDPQKVHQETW